MKRLCYLAIAVVVALGLIVAPATAKSDKASKKAWLGVYTRTVDYNLVEEFDLPVKYGAVVSGVVDDSPADKAGLEEDDVIIRFDGSKITDSEDLVEMINEHRPGDEVTLTVIRENEEIELTVTLEKGLGYDKAIWLYTEPGIHNYIYPFDLGHERPFIGVTLLDLTSQLGDYFGVDKGRGALITEVRDDSPAEKVGLKAGDVIVSIDGDEVFDSEDVRELISEKEAGGKVEVTVIRDKRETRFSVEVAEADDDEDVYSHISIGQFFDHDSKLKAKAKLRALQNIPRVPTLDPDDFPELDPDDFDELQLEMKKLQKELETLQKEMEELREKLK